MSNIELIIEERAADIGNFLVGRLLPFHQKRAVGPFVFIDHMGPATMQAHENLDVPPHPHIGLSTLTYLFEGAIMHRDSLGTAVEITPGAVNWMTAGKGIVHSERSPQRLREVAKQLHGLQIWVALPKELQEMEPSFQHVEALDLPHWTHEGINYKLIAGEAFNRKSPVKVYSPLYFIEIENPGAVSREINIGADLYGESALYVLEGSVDIENNHYAPKQILIAKEATLCSFSLSPRTKVYIFGGEALPEKRFIHWNFVHTEQARIEQAKDDWRAQRFPKVPGEDDFVPLP